jgi:hypothetical protein
MNGLQGVASQRRILSGHIAANRGLIAALAHPQFCGATFTIFECRHSLREFPGFVGSANACFFYQRMKDFPAAFAAVLIKVISGSDAGIRDHWRSPSKQGATCGHLTN